MSMNRSYESMYLKKERNRLIQQTSTVDVTAATELQSFGLPVGAGTLSSSSTPVGGSHRVGRLADRIAQFEGPARSAPPSAGVPKSVSFQESCAEDCTPSAPEDEVLFLPEPPSPPRRPMFVSARRTGPSSASRSPEPRRRPLSPAGTADMTAGPQRSRSRSPGGLRGVLADPSVLAGVDWARAFECRQVKQEASRPRPLSEALRTIPLTAKGTKLNAVGVYITQIDTLPGALAGPVTTLFLSNNSLPDLRGVAQFENARAVSFSNNLIRYLHDLYPLRTLKHMDKLSLEGNIVVHMPYYRQLMLALCPGLQFLDGVRVMPTERQAAEVHSRKATAVMEQLRTNELRAAVLKHLSTSVACHTELIRTVRGRFSVLRGAHIGGAVVEEGELIEKANRQECGDCLASMLRCLEGGGVFRWLQIGCNDSFGRIVQNISYRIYLSALRNMPLDARAGLHHNTDGLRLLWDKLLSEYLHKQQEMCLELIESSEVAVLARHGSVPPNLGGGRYSSTDALNAISRLQLEGMSSEAPEYRLTYCGLGPHLLARPRAKVVKATEAAELYDDGCDCFEHAPMDISSTVATPRKVRAISTPAGVVKGTPGHRVVIGDRFLEPKPAASARNSPSMPPIANRSPPRERGRNASLSPTRMLQQTPQMWAELTEEERSVIREREGYVGPMDGGYAELSQRYDDILQRHLSSGGASVRSSRSHSRSPPHAPNTPMPSSTHSARQLYTRSPPRPTNAVSPCQPVLDATSTPWSSYTARQSIPFSAVPASTGGITDITTTPVTSAPMGDLGRSPSTLGRGVFSPATLPPQQRDPDSELRPGPAPAPAQMSDNNEELLSDLLWGSSDGAGANKSPELAPPAETVPAEISDELSSEPFNPEQEAVQSFLASLATDGTAESEEGRGSRRYTAALVLIKACEAVWDTPSLEKMMYDALRTTPLGPHPEAARGSWMAPNSAAKSPSVSSPPQGSSGRKVSPKRTSGGVVDGADSMRCLKSQFEATSRTFGKIYEDIMTTYEAQQMLRQNAESMRERLLARSRQATRLLLDLRRLLDEEGGELAPARGWTRLAERNSAQLMVYVSSNEEKRMQIDACYREIEGLSTQLNEAVCVQEAINHSIDEVLTAAEGLHTDMTENPAVTSAIRYNHIVGLAVKHFASKTYIGLIQLYFYQLRRRVRRQSRIRRFYRSVRAREDRDRLRWTLDAWMAYTTRVLRLAQAAVWVRRSMAGRVLLIWRFKYATEVKMGVGIAVNWQLRKKHALLYLYRNAAMARRLVREEHRNLQVCSKFTLHAFFKKWLRYNDRLTLHPPEAVVLTARAVAHRLRHMLAAWRQVAATEREECYYSKLIPCLHGAESCRLLASMRAWKALLKSVVHLRQRRYSIGFGSLLKKIISVSVQSNAQQVASTFVSVAKLRPAFIFYRDWAQREGRNARIFAQIYGRFKDKTLRGALKFWSIVYSDSKRRKQDVLINETKRVAADLHNANKAMDHYFRCLLSRSFADWRRGSRQLKSFRLIAQAEEELRVATEAYDKLAFKQKAAGAGSRSGGGDSTVKHASVASRISRKKKEAWLLSLDLVSSDDDTAPLRGSAEGRMSSSWDRPLSDIKTSELQYRVSVGQGLASTEMLTDAGSGVIVREYTHASHFEVRFKAVLRRWNQAAKTSAGLRFCASSVVRRREHGYMQRALSHMLCLWARGAMRKVAVVRLYAENKQNAASENLEFRTTLQRKKAQLATLKESLEEARADLADKQVTAQECKEKLESFRRVKDEKELEARAIEMDQQAIEQQTRLIVSQYEALIARPSVFEEDEANPSFYTPETSLCRDSNNSSRLPPEHVSQLLHMQSQRDSLDEEIHSLHLAYLSLQSTGDANERTLRESKYTAEHLSEQCQQMVLALEAQLSELQKEREVASSVLLSCSRELSQSQATVTHRLGNIEADMMNLETEQEDLRVRLEAAQAEEKQLREELERLWEKERSLDGLDNIHYATNLATEEMSVVDRVSAATASLGPAADRLDAAQLQAGNSFLSAIKVLGSSIENHVGYENKTTEKSSSAGKVRASLVKTSDQINRQRISELVQLQSSSGPAQSAAKELSLADVKFSLSELRDSRSVENVSCSTTHKDSEDIDSEIATIARRIRDRLMMPSSTRITGGHDSVPEC